jgi:hypothetical protein
VQGFLWQHRRWCCMVKGWAQGSAGWGSGEEQFGVSQLIEKFVHLCTLHAGMYIGVIMWCVKYGGVYMCESSAPAVSKHLGTFHGLLQQSHSGWPR